MPNLSALRKTAVLFVVFPLLAVAPAPVEGPAPAARPSGVLRTAAPAFFFSDSGAQIVPPAGPIRKRKKFRARVLFRNTSTVGGGPLAVQQARVVLTGTAGLTFTGATPDQGTCTVEPTRVQCELGAVDAGASPGVDVDAVPTQAGSQTLTATVSHELFDPDPNNNSAQHTFTVVDVSSITGVKFEDLDGDGVRDDGEPGLDGWVVRLLDAGGAEAARDTTAAFDLDGDGTIEAGEEGVYRFDDLDAGSYLVAEVAQPGYHQSLPGGDGPHEVVLAAGQDRTGIDFGNYRDAALFGAKFADLDGDGQRGDGEGGLAGWPITVTGTTGLGEPVSLELTTGDDGTYAVTGLAPGVYTVAEGTRAGYTQTYPAGGTHQVTLQSGAAVEGLDFGNHPDLTPRDPASVIQELVPQVCPDPGNALGYLRDEPLQPGDVVTTAGDSTFTFEVEARLHMGWIDCEKTALYGHDGALVFLDALTDSTTADTSRTVRPVQWWPVVNGEAYPGDLGVDLTSPDLVYGTGVTFTSGPEFGTVTSSQGVVPAGRRACALLVSGRFNPAKTWEEAALDRAVEWARLNLTQERLGARLDPDDVRTLKNPTPGELLAAIYALAGQCDTLYFYYAGHGSSDGLLVLQEEPVLDGYLSYETVAAALASVGAEELIVLIDACYSGLAVEAFSETSGLRDKDVTLVTSSSGDRPAWFDPVHVDGTGEQIWLHFFSYHFWRCYGDPGADADGDGVVSFAEALECVRQKNPVYPFKNEPLVSLTEPQLLTKQSITVAKSVAQSYVEVGQTITYVVTVKNPDEHVAARDVGLADALPATVAFTRATTTQGMCDGAGRNVTCTLGTIAPGDSVVVTIDAQAVAPGDAANTAVSGLRSGAAEFTISAPPAFALCGQKFVDLDRDGVQDDDEPGLDGFDFELLDAGGTVIGTARSAPEDVDGDGVIDEQTERGRFCFRDLPRGTYTLREVPRPQWTQTAPPPPGTVTVEIATGSIPRIRFGNAADGDADPPGGEEDADPVPDGGGGGDDPRDVPVPDSVGYDYGDLPDPRLDLVCPAGAICYPTLWFPGPWHVIDRNGPFLGRLVDDDVNGIPDVTAMGDDVFDLVDDEDGLLGWAVQDDGALRFDLFATLEPGEPAVLDVWIDLDDDGVFGFLEHVVAAAPVAGATGPFTVFTPPGTLGPDDRLSYARFRISTTGSALPTGGAVDGEVEDYLLLGADFGDAPSAPDPARPQFPGGYPTTIAQNGARHVAVFNVRLGDYLDADDEVSGSFDAREDDANRPQDDEDGFAFLDGFTEASSAEAGAFFDVALGATLRLLPLPSTDGRLDAWVDWNRDGDWDDDGEQVFTSEPLYVGMREEDALTLAVPTDAGLGYTYARFRFSRLGGHAPTGAAADGEVEDYLLRVVPEGPTSTEAAAGVPERFALYANYPNPFNPSTVIRYDLAARAGVRLVVYDVLGRVVATLVDGEQPAGRYRVTWDGRSDAGEPVASGVYLYRLEAGDFVRAQRMLLVK